MERVVVLIVGVFIFYTVAVIMTSSNVIKGDGGSVTLSRGQEYIIPGSQYVRCNVDGDAYSVIPNSFTVWGTGPTIYSERHTLNLKGGYGFRNEGSGLVMIQCSEVYA
jgi:hypothetical protein